MFTSTTSYHIVTNSFYLITNLSLPEIKIKREYLTQVGAGEILSTNLVLVSIFFPFLSYFFFFFFLFRYSSVSLLFLYFILFSFFLLLKWIYHICSCMMIITIWFHRISIPQPKHIPPPPKLSPPETISFSMSVSQHLFYKEVQSVLFSDSTWLTHFRIILSTDSLSHICSPAQIQSIEK